MPRSTDGQGNQTLTADNVFSGYVQPGDNFFYHILMAYPLSDLPRVDSSNSGNAPVVISTAQNKFTYALTPERDDKTQLAVFGLTAPARAAEPAWPSDGDPGWNTSGTVKYMIKNNVLFFEPVSGNTGTFETSLNSSAPWMNQPELKNITAIQAKGTLNFSNPYTSLYSSFANCSKLSDISGLSHFDTKNVTGMDSMFSGDPALTDLTALKNWDVSNVSSMNYMFSGDSGLTNLAGLEDWNVSNVQDMSNMFYGNSSLTSLKPLKNWNVSKVTDMTNMFYNNTGLTNLSGLENWDVSHVTNMYFMFGVYPGPSALTDLTALKNWDVSSVTTISVMFSGVPWQRVGIPSAKNGGAKFLNVEAGLDGDVISEDGNVGPFTQAQLQEMMTKNPNEYRSGRIWVRYTPSWFVVFNGNAGSGAPVIGVMPNQMIKMRDSLTVPKPSFFRLGYKFIGWSTQPDDRTNLIQPGTSWAPASPTEKEKYSLYAQWESDIPGGGLPQTITGGMLPGWVQDSAWGTEGTIISGQTQEAGFRNRYAPGSTSVSIRLSKTVDGDVPDAAQRYKFNLYDSHGTILQTVQNTAGSLQFSPLSFTQAGKFTYFVREDSSSVPTTMNSDQHAVQVTVTVKDDPTRPGQLTTTVQYVGDLTFRNVSKPGSLTITKNVAGTPTAQRSFTMHVILKDRDHNPVSGTFDGYTFTDGQADITIGGGKSVTIADIPAYTSYTVTEPNVPAGWKLTGSDNTTGTIDPEDKDSATLTNTYKTKPGTAMIHMIKKVLLGPNNAPGEVEANKYHFTMCEKQSDGSCAGVSEATAMSDGSITFPQLSYNQPGTHTYEIRETDDHDQAIRYDTNSHSVTVEVTDNGSGRLVTSVTGDNKTFTNHIPQLGSMPQTGQMGVWPFLIAAVIVLVGGVVLIVIALRHNN
jgi:pilin isopeptide linkage protein